MKIERDNSGLLFKNDRKEQPTHADYRGEVKVGGVDYWISAWIKDGQRGKFMGLSFKVKEPREPVKPEFDDEVPF